MSSAPWSLSDVVAGQVFRLRKRGEITREQLAERCAELGYPALTAPALANIETGRRTPDGRRRRDVTADELVVLAKALRVPPLLLMLPVGTQESIEILPGVSVPTWEAAQWFTGEAPFPGTENLDNYGLWEFTVGDPSDLRAYRQGGAPLTLLRRHGNWAQQYAVLRREIDQLSALGETPQDQPGLENQARRALRELRTIRGEMRRHGLPPPALPPALVHVDAAQEVDTALPIQPVLTRPAYSPPASGDPVTDSPVSPPGDWASP